VAVVIALPVGFGSLTAGLVAYQRLPSRPPSSKT
jgi:hypothetical protein